MSRSNEEKWCAVTWKIKNFSYWATDVYQDLRSPTFKTPATGIRLMELKLLTASKNDGEFVVRLHRLWGEPFFHHLMYDLSVLASNGQVLNLTPSIDDDMCTLVVSDFSCTLPEIESNIFLPEDTLTLRLKMQHYEPVNIECFTRTVLHQENFLWKIKNFSGAQPVVTKNFQFAFHHFVLNLYKSHHCPPEVVEIQIVQTFGQPLSFLSYRFSIVRADGQELAKYDYNDFVTTPAGNNKYIKIVLQKDFLENDMLLLQWEFTVGVGEFTHENQDVVSDPTQTAASMARKNLPRPPSSRTLRKDLLCMYKDRKFCDATLKTEGMSFPVHKSILCVRSPVFSDMFESDMEESRTSEVDIPDIQPGTMERMLMFLYTDFLEEIHFDEACSLYYAADKYAIQTLKDLCVSVLMAELDASNICDALVLADTHQDDKLMQSVQDFIWSHDEVICSNEWKVLEESRPLLTIRLFRDMHFKKGKK